MMIDLFHNDLNKYTQVFHAIFCTHSPIYKLACCSYFVMSSLKITATRFSVPRKTMT